MNFAADRLAGELGIADKLGVMTAEPDLEIRKGGGMTEDRPFLTWEQYVEYQHAGRDVRKFALAYYGPHPKTGVPGGDTRVQIALPAEKQAKWWGQGYRPVGYVQPPPPPRSQRWYPSMVEEAIANGEAIPEELRPPGYYGPTFKAGAAAVTPAQIARAGAAPPLFYCTAEGCARFFDSDDGRKVHERSHKE